MTNPHPIEDEPGRAHLAGILVAGLIAISFASIFIKLCRAPSLTIATYRLVIASLFYLLVVRLRTGRTRPRITRTRLKFVLISGVFLTIHFAAWITSLSYTSVASSVVLVQSAPIFVAIGSTVFLGEKPSASTILGILVTLTGSALVGVHDFRIDGMTLTGNLLAVAGAVGAAGYIIAGRNLREHLDTFTYVSLVYPTAAVLLLILTAGSGVSFIGFDASTYLLLLAIAVFPQIIGHTVFNWSLKYISATTVSIILLGEPVGASILALVLLGEPLGAGKIVGGAVILCGVMLVLRSEAKQRHIRSELAMHGQTVTTCTDDQSDESEGDSFPTS